MPFSFIKQKRKSNIERLHLGLSLLCLINYEPNIDQYKVTEEQTNIGQHWHMLERNECDRVCSKNEIPKTCHFKFIIEQHTSMGKVAVPRFNISMIHTFI